LDYHDSEGLEDVKRGPAGRGYSPSAWNCNCAGTKN